MSQESISPALHCIPRLLPLPTKQSLDSSLSDAPALILQCLLGFACSLLNYIIIASCSQKLGKISHSLRCLAAGGSVQADGPNPKVPNVRVLVVIRGCVGRGVI